MLQFETMGNCKSKQRKGTLESSLSTKMYSKMLLFAHPFRRLRAFQSSFFQIKSFLATTRLSGQTIPIISSRKYLLAFHNSQGIIDSLAFSNTSPLPTKNSCFYLHVYILLFIMLRAILFQNTILLLSKDNESVVVGFRPIKIKTQRHLLSAAYAINSVFAGAANMD